MAEFKAHIEAHARKGGTCLKVIVGENQVVDGYKCTLYGWERGEITRWIIEKMQGVDGLTVTEAYGLYNIKFQW